MHHERFVAIDRDGVINEESDAYIKSGEEWNPIPGSIDGITRLTQAGFRIAIVTNQSGLARGLFDLAALNEIHNKLRECLSIAGGQVDMILFCPHGPWDHCGCRKPEPGLFLKLAERLGFQLKNMPYVCDSITDVEVALRVGMEPILVRTGKGERIVTEFPEKLTGIKVFANLREAADNLIDRWRIS